MTRAELLDVILRPETFGLMHAYYTPMIVANAIQNTLGGSFPELVDRDGEIMAPRPSAGIGRLVRALAPRNICGCAPRPSKEHEEEGDAT